MTTSDTKYIYCSLLMSTYLVLYIGVIKLHRYYQYVMPFFLLFITIIKYFVIPLLIYLDDGYWTYSPHDSTECGVFFVRGVLFSMWECIFIGFFLYKKLPIWYNTKSSVLIHPKFKKESNVVLLFELFFFLGLVALYAEAINNYSFMFNLEGKEALVEERVSTGLTETLATIGIRCIKILLPIPFAYAFYQGYKRSRNSMYFFLTAIFFVVFYALIMEGDSRNTIIIPAISIIFILITLYPSYRKQTWTTMVVLIVVISVLSILFKSFGNRVEDAVEASQLSYWINYLDAYFAGVTNMGRALTAKMNYGLGISPVILFNDLFGNVPFLTKLTDYTEGSHFLFSQVWGRTDQIIPASGNGLFYFGYFLSPTVPIAGICLAHYFEKLRYKSITLGEFVVYTYACAMVSYNMFNQVQSMMMKITISIMPVVIAVYINKKAVSKKTNIIYN